MAFLSVLLHDNKFMLPLMTQKILHKKVVLSRKTRKMHLFYQICGEKWWKVEEMLYL